MRSVFLTAFLASALLPLAGCNLYFNGGGDPPCDEWGGGPGAPGLAEPIELLRNPETGVCEDWSWNGPTPWPCDSECGPCAGSAGSGDGTTDPNTTPPPSEPGDEPTDSGADREAPGAAQQPPPTWGHCESFCTGLDEQTCLATDRCRGIYDQGPSGPGEFRECWETDYSDYGVVDCEGLDAYSCSTSDACVAVHEFACDDGNADPIDPDGFQEPGCTPGFFLSCHNEGPAPDGCYGIEDCDEGFSCNAADICLPPPGSGNGDEAVPAVCYGYCVPDVDPGECDGEVLCDSLPPLCEAGSTPGIADGCWTGACIPLELCPDQTECAEIQSESLCIAREDCSSYYVGDNCSCDESGCICDDWLFDSCAQEAP